jgi:uncharacterized membrane protein YraQ (UPF0718 family)
VLPLFGGIFKRGAGLGPAVAFLYSGPAINVLAIVYSARLLGYDIGVARASGAIAFSIVIGLAMAFLFRKEKTAGDERAFAALSTDPDSKKIWQLLIFFAALVGILVFAASKNWIWTGVSFAVLGVSLWRWFNLQDIKFWMLETVRFVRLIFPWLIGGVFLAGIIKALIPDSAIAATVGQNNLLSNGAASVFGVTMYFATLTEVPIIRAFTDMGMSKGPALALLLSGPALSLPSILVLRNIMGWKKTLTFVALVAVMATFTGYMFGLITL